jgi:hypothetical protein
VDIDETMRRLIASVENFKRLDAAGYHLSAIDEARTLITHWDDLDHWLRTGGYLPLRWARAGAQRRPLCLATAGSVAARCPA